MSAPGTKRRFAVPHRLGSYWRHSEHEWPSPPRPKVSRLTLTGHWMMPALTKAGYRWKILRRHSACVLEPGKSEAFELWLVRKRKQPTCCPDRSHGAMQGDLSALKRGYKSDIAEPRLCEGIKIRRDDHVDIPCGSFETNLDIFGPEHQPPIARAVTGFRYAAKIEANDKTLRRYLRGIDLPAHSPDEHSGIEVIRTAAHAPRAAKSPQRRRAA